MIKEQEINQSKKQKSKVIEGLTNKQVEERKKAGLVNYDTSLPSKSIKAILFENIFTLFNFINLVLAIAVYLVGSYKNMLFLGIVLINTLISVIQEIRSKKAVDRLSVISQSKIKVRRQKQDVLVDINELVLDDVMFLQAGDQIVTDSILLDGSIEVNESFITGEPNAIAKKQGELLRSGSFVVSGNAYAKVEHIGKDNYTAKISSGAKYIKKIKSEIMTSLKKIVSTVSFVIIPVGILLFFQQLDIMGNTIPQAVVNTVAALIGMIPEGLVLLTSTVLAVSTIRLSENKVLVQDLYCIEMLARVDTLCLDKTGTITEGKMEVSDLIPIKSSKGEVEEILGQIGKVSKDKNETIEAIRAKYKAKNSWDIDKTIPFSSDRKWSAGFFKEQGNFIMGAPEIVLEEKEYKEYEEKLQEYAKESRVLVLTKAKDEFEKDGLPQERELIAFILIKDKIRKQAKETLNYFKKQGVNIKLISGDNPITVSKIAKRVGLKDYDKYIDASTLQAKEQIDKAVEKYTIFGRVSPIQKREILQSLKEKGHTVAMTGDGVNDVLALKEADCSIAMASGSDAARNVSQLVLLDSDFKSMPKVVAEGRRSINNLQRSASLFLVKTIYSTILAILFIFVDMQYPFIPIQLTLISTLAIGIPSFVLALEPNNNRLKGKFIKNVISKSLPAAVTIILNIFLVFFANQIFNLDHKQYSTVCVLLTALTEFTLLLKICRPFNKIRIVLFTSMIAIFTILFTFMSAFFNLVVLDAELIKICIILGIISFMIFVGLYFLAEKIFKINEEK